MSKPDRPEQARPATPGVKPERRPAAPLQLVGMGLLIVFLRSGGAYDVFANPVGWLLVLAGTAKLPLPQRGLLTGLAGVALAVAVPLWFPQVRGLLDADPSLGWAAQLPEFAYLVVLCRSLMSAARPTHPAGHVRFATLSVLLLVALAVPPVAIAADSSLIGNIGIGLLVVTQVWLVWSLFSHCRKPYADAVADPSDDKS